MQAKVGAQKSLHFKLFGRLEGFIEEDKPFYRRLVHREVLQEERGIVLVFTLPLMFALLTEKPVVFLSVTLQIPSTK